MSKIEINFDKAAFDKIDNALAAIETNVRGPAINKGLRAIGAHVKNKTQAILPKAGYTRYTRTKGEPYQDKSGYKPLEKTIKTKIVGNQGVIRVAVIGYEWPAGAHGHLVEMGHDMVVGGSKERGGRTVGKVAPAEYMVKVVAAERSTFDSIIINEVKNLLKI